MGRFTSLFGSIAAINVMSHFGMTETVTHMATGASGNGPEAFFYNSLASLAAMAVSYKVLRRIGDAA